MVNWIISSSILALTKGKPNVYLVSELSSSCLFGASIYIREADVVDKKKAECIIAHERAHYKHLDHIWSVLRMAALCLHWYNPIVWIAVRLSKRDSELASDFSTVQKLGEERRIEYGEILLSMFTAKHSERNAFNCATTMNSGKKGIKERIKMITKKPRIISIALAVVMIVMTVASCGTFTSPKETAGEESLSHQTQHIEKQISDNLSINADVENNVKNLNSYNARLYTVENDFLQSVFLKDREIVESTNGDGTFELFATENDDRVVNYHAKGFTEEFVFETQKVLDRELQYFFYAHGGVHLDRDNRFKVKELDFMSSADAVAIAKDYMQQIGIGAADYKVYSFDVEYLQGVMDKEIEISTAAGITLEELAEMGPLEYTKDDEFYLVVPDLTLPDGSKLTEVSTTVSTSCAAYELTSDQVYMIVDKNGLALFEGKGIYSVVSTRETDLNIISAEEALDKILPRYNGIKNTVKITHGELAYVPQIENIDEGTYVLKPAWVFDVTETESGVPEEYATRYRIDAVDAVTGEMIEIDRNGY